MTASAVNNNLDLSGPPQAFPPAVPITSDQAQVNCSTPTENLFVSKTDGKTTVDAGGSTTYTITVTNSGPSTVSPTLVDPAATNLTKTLVACGPVPGQCVSAPTIGALEAGYTLPALASGQTYQIAVTATVAAAATGSVNNAVTVTPPALTVNTGVGCVSDATNTRSFNQQTGACSSSDTDTVGLVSDLRVLKTDGKTSVNAGTSTIYTITVTNSGPSTVSPTLIDLPATGLSKTLVACGPAPGQCASPPNVATLEAGFTLPPLASGQTYQITVTAMVRRSAVR